MKYTIKIAVGIFVMLFFTAQLNKAQAKKDTTNHKMMNHMMGDSSKMMNHKMMDNQKSKMEKNPVVHDGVIDLKSIDKNKDGKVFQDQMDWNVISDKAGDCPLCGMTLKEVTLDKAKENLVKHHFKVKK